jgi:hypothetical protein
VVERVCDMDELQAQRRLVKSPPELWAEVSDEDVLRHHLAPFGAIRITRREPESTVAWEGERASGTVSLDAAGWGTRVTLTAVPATPAEGEPWVDPRRWVAPEEEAWAQEPPARPEPEPVAEEPEPEPIVEEEPVAVEAEPEPEPERRGFLARLFRRRPKAEITPPAPPSPDPAPPVPRPDPTPAPPIDPPAPSPDPTPPIDPTPEPDPVPEPAIEVREPELPAAEALEALEAMLDHLGSAHHRPFSRT